MTGRHLHTGTLAAGYLLWLAAWLIIGDAADGPGWHYWDQAGAAAATGLLAFHVSRRVARPYPGFLVIQGIAFLLLAGSWVTYEVSGTSSGAVAIPVSEMAGWPEAVSDGFYAGAVFTMMCAWGALALEQWHRRPLSRLTAVVFAATMAGLGAIFAVFYRQQYGHLLDTMLGRLDAVTAAFEFLVLAMGLLCMLLKEPAPILWMLVGTAVLMAGDMAYSVDDVPRTIEAVWMFGQFLLLAAIVRLPGAGPLGTAATASPDRAAEAIGRSELSGILILVSLGAVLLAPVVWFLPVAVVWKSFLAVLFVLALVAILVWLTDRVDDTIAFLRGYVRGVHQSQLVSGDWRGAGPEIDGTLRSTGLDGFLDDFRDSAARLRGDVLFLGPERLYAPPKTPDRAREASCFIVMPFGQEWSADVHRILAEACIAAGVRPVRGDDLFTPTDILEDIWQSINAADFLIADITGRNPNVLYELGIAHALAKPVLILSREAVDIPIDLATRRVILYGQHAAAWREELARMIAEAIAKVMNDYRVRARTVEISR